jgi:archaellum component FlaF (FlaF/FlaG flagellin family)
MQKLIPLFVLLLIFGYAVYNTKQQGKIQSKTKSNSTYAKHIQTHHTSHTKEELALIRSDAYLKHYIIDVINHGSTQLQFKKNEVMEAGFAPKEDAEKIACYVMALSGRKCKTPYPADAAGFYTSICGGCHGDHGKGTQGAYPDLTKNPLLGIKKREVFLRSKVAH